MHFVEEQCTLSSSTYTVKIQHIHFTTHTIPWKNVVFSAYCIFRILKEKSVSLQLLARRIPLLLHGCLLPSYAPALPLPWGKIARKKDWKKFQFEHLYLTQASISIRIRYKKTLLALASYSPALHWGKNANKDWDKASIWTHSSVIKA